MLRRIRIRQFLEKIMKQIDCQSESVATSNWMIVLASMVVIRTFVIFAEQGLPDRSFSFVTIFYFQDLFFFLMALLLVWIWLALFLRVRPRNLSRLMLWGTWLVILPPIIDWVAYGKIFWSFYLFNDIRGLWSQYYSIFGHLPPAIVYFGSKITCILAVVATSGFVYCCTKKVWKAIVNGWAVYSIFFLMGSFPSWLAYLYYYLARGQNIIAVTIADVAGFIASPAEIFGIKYYSLGGATMFKMNFVYFLLSLVLSLLLLWLSGKEKAKAVFGKIVNDNQIYLQLAVFFFGFGIIGFGSYPQNFNHGFFAWLGLGVLSFGIIANSMADNILLDSKNWKDPKDFLLREQAIIFSIIALGGFFIAGVKFFLVALVYRMLVLFYFQNQFGSKTFWPVKYFLKWASLLMSLIFGFMLVSQNQTLDQFPAKLGLWLTLGLSTVFNIGNITFKKHEMEKSEIFSSAPKKIMLEILVFSLFIAGFMIFSGARIFWLSVILGGASFWIVEKESCSKFHILRFIFLIYLFFVFAVF